MNSGFKSQVVPSYRLLTEDQIREIHLASLDILETVGVRVNHDEAVQMLAAAGCRVKPGNIVQIPGWLVDTCIRSAPSRITIYNRLGDEAMRLEGRKIHYGLGTDLIKTRDVRTGRIAHVDSRGCQERCARRGLLLGYRLRGFFRPAERSQDQHDVHRVLPRRAGEHRQADLLHRRRLRRPGDDDRNRGGGCRRRRGPAREAVPDQLLRADSPARAFVRRGQQAPPVRGQGRADLLHPRGRHGRERAGFSRRRHRAGQRRGAERNRHPPGARTRARPSSPGSLRPRWTCCRRCSSTAARSSG